MSNVSDINNVLYQIESVISGYSDEDLSEYCRKSGKDFFEFMQSKGVHPGWCYKLIVEQFNIPPQRLHTSSDFALLREAIYAYENTIGVTPVVQKERSHQSVDGIARDVANFFFGRSNGL